MDKGAGADEAWNRMNYFVLIFSRDSVDTDQYYATDIWSPHVCPGFDLKICFRLL